MTMNSAVCFVVSYAINAVWQVPLLAAAGFAAGRVLRRWGPQAQHVAWVTTLLLSSITPALTALRGSVLAAISRARIPAGGGASVVITAAGPDFAVRAGTVLLPPAAIWTIFGLFVFALAWFAARFLLSIAATQRLVRESFPLALADGDAVIWERVRRAFPGPNPRLLSSIAVPGIMTSGARSPSIILPADFAGRWTGEDLLSGLAHEVAHVQRRDYAKNLLYEAARVLTAFHPVSWMVRAQVARTREMICDAMVIDRVADRKQYRQSLLRMAGRMAMDRRVAFQAMGLFDANILEERIMMMKLKRKAPSLRVRAMLMGCAVLLLLGGVIGGTAFAIGVAAPASVHTGRAEEVYKLGDGVTAPVLTYAPDPEYTNRARKAHYQGICVVGLIVGSDGRPKDVHVVRALGMGLDQNAVRAVKQYRFKPASFEGKPVPVELNIQVNFRVY